MFRIRILTILTFAALTACASKPHVHIDQIKEGMDKAVVLDKAGSPKRTFRSNGQDHWIYVFFKGDQELTRQIDFLDGKVVRIGRDLAKHDWDKEIEGMKKPAKAGGFKSIDGGK